MYEMFSLCGGRLREGRVVVLLVFLALSSGFVARAQDANGALRGRVEDLTAARVSGASVVAVAAGTSLSREAESDGRGEFLIPGLPPGTYQVR